MKKKISLSRCVFNKKNYNNNNVEDVLQRIKNGINRQHIDLIETIRNTDEKWLRDLNKESLNVWQPNGLFGNKRADSLIELNGLMYFDIDDLENPEEVKNKLKTLKYVYAAWLSASGKGIGFLCYTAGLTADNFKSTWKTIENEINATTLHDIEFDTSVSSISKPNYISYDPDIYVSEDVKAYEAVNEFKKYSRPHSLPFFASAK